jgi:hypothetical protein
LGGFLGIGNDSYPIPWATLKYDTSLGSYRTTITEEPLKGAPKDQGESWDWEDDERRRTVYDYYNTPWIEHGPLVTGPVATRALALPLLPIRPSATKSWEDSRSRNL